MSEQPQRQNIFVSRDSISQLARALAISDTMLADILKASENAKTHGLSLNPETLIAYITKNRPLNIEASPNEQN